MPIVFRHDAAAVMPPSNSATRKYGQSLVLQQQQQKYAAQQAANDRMFDAYRQQNQNQFQLARDQMQNNFMLGRNNMQFGQRQQLQDDQQQARFLENAQKQSGRFLMDAIEKGEFDPSTSKELRQNLIDEAEALYNPNLDATQRAEALQALRGRRTVLAANRQPKDPPPTAQELFNQSIVSAPDGLRYRQNAKGDFEPLQQQPQRPTSSDEAFRADPKIRDKYMEDAKTILTEGGTKPLTRESRREAAILAKELYDEDNNLGQPTLAPELPNAGRAMMPQAQGSILENPQIGNQQAGPTAQANLTAIPTQREILNAIVSDLLAGKLNYQYETEGAPGSPTGGIGQIPNYVPGTSDVGPIPNHSGLADVGPIPNYRPPNGIQDSQIPTNAPPMMGDLQPPAPPARSILESPAPNPWAEVATGDTAAAPPNNAAAPGAQREPLRLGTPTSPNYAEQNVVPMQLPEEQMKTLSKSSGLPKATMPNWSDMIAKTRDSTDRTFLNNMRGVYQGQSPNVQNAIAILVDPKSSDSDADRAVQFLTSAGIDVMQLAKPKASGGGRRGKSK